METSVPLHIRAQPANRNIQRSCWSGGQDNRSARPAPRPCYSVLQRRRQPARDCRVPRHQYWLRARLMKVTVAAAFLQKVSPGSMAFLQPDSKPLRQSGSKNFLLRGSNVIGNAEERNRLSFRVVDKKRRSGVAITRLPD